MRALTLSQPVPECILRHGQRMIRRAEEPSPEVLGERIAIHAGEYTEAYHSTHRFPVSGYLKLDLPLGLTKAAVVATARVCGFFVAESEARGGRTWAIRGSVTVVGSAFGDLAHLEKREPKESALHRRDLRLELISEPWWSLSDLYCPIDSADRAREQREGKPTFVEGAVRAFGWILDEVREVDPPVSTVRPLRSHVLDDGTWELGRVAEREVSMREEYALEQRAQTENAT